MSQRSAIIACGGTGGHLAPGIALAQGLQKEGVRSVLLISEKQVDARIVRHYPQLAFVAVPSAPLLLNPLRLAGFAVRQGRGILRCRRLFREHRPDLLVAFGGFTSLGAVLAARAEGVPVVLHEANRKVGRAIRTLKGFARRIYLPPGIRLAGVEPRRIRHYGFPVRDEIRRLPRETARRRLGLPPEGKWLVVLGGSQGAAALNSWVKDNVEALAAEGVNTLCLTGLGKGARGAITRTNAQGVPVQAVFQPFSDDMGAVISAADLVISRAGAGTIAELTRCHKPSILVPYPYAADNHQQENAVFLEKQGGCLVVPQENLGALRGEVRDLLFNDWLLNAFERNLAHLEQADSRAHILRDLRRLMDARDAAPAPAGASPAGEEVRA